MQFLRTKRPETQCSGAPVSMTYHVFFQLRGSKKRACIKYIGNFDITCLALAALGRRHNLPSRDYETGK